MLQEHLGGPSCLWDSALEKLSVDKKRVFLFSDHHVTLTFNSEGYDVNDL